MITADQGTVRNALRQVEDLEYIRRLRDDAGNRGTGKKDKKTLISYYTPNFQLHNNIYTYP